MKIRSHFYHRPIYNNIKILLWLLSEYNIIIIFFVTVNPNPQKIQKTQNQKKKIFFRGLFFGKLGGVWKWLWKSQQQLYTLPSSHFFPLSFFACLLLFDWYFDNSYRILRMLLYPLVYAYYITREYGFLCGIICDGVLSASRTSRLELWKDGLPRLRLEWW